MQPLLNIVEFVLPQGTLEWFDVADSSMTSDELRITLVEKNHPPLTPEMDGLSVKSKGFTDITVVDFPIRGRRTSLTFRRRYWQVEGRHELLKREIHLCAPGTQLATEFANFLKDASRETRDLFDEYC